MTFLILAYRASTRMQIAFTYAGSMTLHLGPILRLNEILNDEGKEFFPLAGQPFHTLQRGLEFRSVCLKYGQDQKSSVSNLSFKIPKGAITAIVGPSGAGKSSVLDMIIRLYEPTSGEILIDGEPISKFEMSSWRASLGVVSQDSCIFNDSVEENIRFGVDHAAEEEIIEAAKLSGAHGFIMKLEQGYETKLGERGYKLSGGEIQRISLARALLKNPQILILDEATSSLDRATEREIQNSLELYSRNRTVIVIAHRLSTITMADQIIFIENGTIVESGTHSKLIESNGKYAHLWHLQSHADEAPLFSDRLIF